MSLVTTVTLAGETVSVTGGTLREGDLTADRRLYVDREGKVVEANDPSRRFLLAAKGAVIPKEQVEALGLRMEGGRVVWEGMEDAAETPVASAQEAQETPPE